MGHSRVYAVLFAAALIAHVLAAAAEKENTVPNDGYVSNPSFEMAENGMPSGYKCEPIPGKTAAKAVCSLTNDAHTGSNALVVRRLNDGGIYGVYPPFAKVAPSDTKRFFKASVWMKSASPQGTISANVQCSDARWSKGYFQYYQDVTSEWAEYSVLIQLDPGLDISYYRICIGYGLTVIGELMFLDDFSFREISADEYGRLAALAKSTGKIVWNSVDTPIKNAPGSNMFRNSSFEDSLEHWGFSYTMQSRSRSDQMLLDSAEKFHGSHSMRYKAWPRWYEAGGRIQSAPIPVQKGRTYTMSAYMKCNETNIAVVLEARYAAMQAPAVTKSFPLTDQWQRCSLSFEVGNCPKGTAIACIAMPNTWLRKDDFSSRNIWIDAVQFEEGGLSTYAPSRAVEITGSAAAPHALFSEGDAVTLTTKIIAPESTRVSMPWKITYSFENVFGDIVDTHTAPLARSAIGASAHSFTWDTKLLGSFCAHVSLTEGDTIIAKGITVFAVLPDLTERDRSNAGLFGVETTSSADYCAIAKKIGAGSVRLHSDNYLRWIMLQQDKGDAPWYEPEKDAVLRDLKRSGMHILANMELGSMWATTAAASIKDYDRQKYPPDPNAWRTFVQSQAEHFKGIVDAWEIWNEPYLQHWWMGTPAQYVSLLASSYQEIKKVDPNLTVAGICGQLSANGWNTDCVKAGALNSMDALSFHMYLSRQSGGPEEDWMKHIGDNRTLMQEAGKTVPIWNSECGVGDGHDSYYTPFYSGVKAPTRMSPALLAQAYAVALAAGVERHYWFILSEDNGPSGSGGLALLEYNGTPKPIIPAFTASAKCSAEKSS